MNLAFLQDFGPVAILVMGAGVCASMDLLAPGPRRPIWNSRWVVVLAAVLAFAASIGFWHSSHSSTPPDIEHASFLIDRFALFFYAAALAAVVAIVLCTADLEEELHPHRGVFHALLLVSAAGVIFTASAADLTSLAAGIACATLPASLALGLRKTDLASIRTATRAITLTIITLVVFIAGEAILAGVSGATSLHAIPAGLRRDDPLLVLAAALIIVGAASQLGIVPFSWRMAAESTRLPLGPLLARIILGTLAAVAALLRLLPGALGGVPASWSLTVSILAGATLLLAPIFALRQRRLGPALVYLLIAQMVLALAALPEVSNRSTATILYLLLSVIPVAAGAVGLVGVIALQGNGDRETDLRGLWARSPALCGTLALLLVALAGVPPLAGFFSRMLTVDASLHSAYGWVGWLALVSAGLGALVVGRWLMVIFDARVEGPEFELPGLTTLVGVSLCGGALLFFGILLGPVFAIATRGAVPPLIGP